MNTVLALHGAFIYIGLRGRKLKMFVSHIFIL